MHVSILIANIKMDVLAKRSKPAFWVRGPRHRYEMDLEAMTMLKGSRSTHMLLNWTVMVSTQCLQCFHQRTILVSPFNHKCLSQVPTVLHPPHPENWLYGRAWPHVLLLLPFLSLPGTHRERESEKKYKKFPVL